MALRRTRRKITTVIVHVCAMLLFNTTDICIAINRRRVIQDIPNFEANRRSILRPLLDALLNNHVRGYAKLDTDHDAYSYSEDNVTPNTNLNKVWENMEENYIEIKSLGGLFRVPELNEAASRTTERDVQKRPVSIYDNSDSIIPDLSYVQTSDPRYLTTLTWKVISLTDSSKNRQEHVTDLLRHEPTYRSAFAYGGNSSSEYMKSIGNTDTYLQARYLWIGLGIGAAISIATFIIGVYLYTVLGRHTRRRNCIDLAGFNLCSLKKENIKEPVYIRLSQLHHPRVGSHYVVTILDDTNNLNNNSGWSSEEEIFNISDIKINNSFLSKSAPPNVNMTSTPLKTRINNFVK